MSRNSELLSQAGKEREVFRAFRGRVELTKGRHPRLDLEAPIREEVFKLVQRVFLLPGTDRPRVVVFSGFEHGNGCSWICTHVSEVLKSQVAESVCLVDANLRSPSLHEYFGVDNIVGLAEALLQSGPIRNFAQRLPDSGLWFLPSGFHTLDPHSLLASDALRLRIAELRSAFDHVLIDAPPVNQFADATLLGKIADGIILVIEANSTRRETTRKAKESLEAANVRLLGAVLNKRTFPVPEVLYRKL